MVLAFALRTGADRMPTQGLSGKSRADMFLFDPLSEPKSMFKR